MSHTPFSRIYSAAIAMSIFDRRYYEVSKYVQCYVCSVMRLRCLVIGMRREEGGRAAGSEVFYLPR